MRLKWLGIIALSVGFLNAGESPKPTPQGAAVQSVAVREGSAAQRLEFLGVLHFEEKSALASEVSGVVVEVGAKVGQRLPQGAILARLDSGLLEQEILAKEAQLRQAKAQESKAKRELARLETLRAKQSVSLKEYENALLEREAQGGNVAALEANLARLGLERERKILRLPYEAVILERFLEQGAWVGVGAKVFEVARLGRFEVHASLPYEAWKSLRIDQKIPVQIARQRHEATVVALIPQAEAKSRSFPVRLALESEELEAGLEAKIELTIPQGEGLLVPRDSLLAGEKPALFLLQENKARRVEVEILAYSGAEALIRAKGIAPGDRVIIKGQERLRDKQEVREVQKGQGRDKPKAQENR